MGIECCFLIVKYKESISKCPRADFVEILAQSDAEAVLKKSPSSFYCKLRGQMLSMRDRRDGQAVVDGTSQEVLSAILFPKCEPLA